MSDFVFPAKLFVVTPKPQSPPIIRVVEVSGEICECIPIFTEQLLAERWMIGHQIFQLGTVHEVRPSLHELTVSQTITLLSLYANSDFHVGVDMERGQVRPEWIWPTRDAIIRLSASR